MNGVKEALLIDLLQSQEPDINRIIPLFISRFNAVYGDSRAELWDITKEDWQRYEFLGDRVLSLVIAQALFVHRDAVLNEGEMTEILAGIVSNKSLDAMTREHDPLHLLIPLSLGEQNCYGERITGGAFEAFIGALYCEFGFDDVAVFVNTLFADALRATKPQENAKGLLQEYWQKRGQPLPVYEEIKRSGPDHCPSFTVRVTLPDGSYFEGSGHSRSEAEKSAAKSALEHSG